MSWYLECDHCGGCVAEFEDDDLVSEGDVERCETCSIDGYISIYETGIDGEDGEEICTASFVVDDDDFCLEEGCDACEFRRPSRSAEDLT